MRLVWYPHRQRGGVHLPEWQHVTTAAKSIITWHVLMAVAILWCDWVLLLLASSGWCIHR